MPSGGGCNNSGQVISHHTPPLLGGAGLSSHFDISIIFYKNHPHTEISPEVDFSQILSEYSGSGCFPPPWGRHGNQSGITWSLFPKTSASVTVTDIEILSFLKQNIIWKICEVANRTRRDKTDLRVTTEVVAHFNLRPSPHNSFEALVVQLASSFWGYEADTKTLSWSCSWRHDSLVNFFCFSITWYHCWPMGGRRSWPNNKNKWHRQERVLVSAS